MIRDIARVEEVGAAGGSNRRIGVLTNLTDGDAL